MLEVFFAFTLVLGPQLVRGQTCDDLVSYAVGFSNYHCADYCEGDAIGPDMPEFCVPEACSMLVAQAPSPPLKFVNAEALCQTECQLAHAETVDSCAGYIYDSSSTACGFLSADAFPLVDRSPGIFAFGRVYCLAPTVAPTTTTTKPPTTTAPSTEAPTTVDPTTTEPPTTLYLSTSAEPTTSPPATFPSTVPPSTLPPTSPPTTVPPPPLCSVASETNPVSLAGQAGVAVEEDDGELGCRWSCIHSPSCDFYLFDPEPASWQCAMLQASAAGLVSASPGSFRFGPKECAPTTTTSTASTRSGDCRSGASRLEVGFAQDLSGSSYRREDGAAIAAEILKGEYGEAVFALTSFSDKPVFPLGYVQSWDYCYWLHTPLGDVARFVWQLGRTFSRSGADYREDILDAIHQTATDPRVGWSTKEFTDDGLEVVQVIVVHTDGGVHYAGDGLQYGLVPHDGGTSLRCNTMDYPAIETVANALLGMGSGKVRLRFVVPPRETGPCAELSVVLQAHGVDAAVVAAASLGAADQAEAATAAMDVCGGGSGARVRRLLEKRPAAEGHYMQRVAYISEEFDGFFYS